MLNNLQGDRHFGVAIRALVLSAALACVCLVAGVEDPTAKELEQ